MIRAHDLDGRAVVDLETAKKIGYVDEIYLDPHGGRMTGYGVAEGSKLTGGGQKIMLPAESVESIGPEAIMVRGGGSYERDLDRMGGEPRDHDAFPRLSHVKGRKVVSEAGKLLGTIDDVLLDGADGRIVGYALKDPSWTAGLDHFLGNEDEHPDYVRGDTDLRLGEDLVVVPESAVVRGRSEAHDKPIGSHTARRTADYETERTLDRDTTRPVSRTVIRPTGTGTVHPVDRDATLDRDTTRPLDTATTRPSSHSSEHWDDVRSDFRSRWESRTAGRGGLWEEHEPSYRYGWEAASSPTYRGKTWDSAQPELRRDWETRYHDRPWDRFMAAIREGWDGFTDRDKSDVGGYSDRDRDVDRGPERGEYPAIERLSETPPTPPGSRRPLP